MRSMPMMVALTMAALIAAPPVEAQMLKNFEVVAEFQYRDEITHQFDELCWAWKTKNVLAMASRKKQLFQALDAYKKTTGKEFELPESCAAVVVAPDAGGG